MLRCYDREEVRMGRVGVASLREHLAVPPAPGSPSLRADPSRPVGEHKTPACQSASTKGTRRMSDSWKRVKGCGSPAPLRTQDLHASRASPVNQRQRHTHTHARTHTHTHTHRHTHTRAHTHTVLRGHSMCVCKQNQLHHHYYYFHKADFVDVS